MKAKRILSALLTALMLVSVLACLPLTSGAAEADLIYASYTNPAIPAEAGKAITLANVRVAFDASNTYAADLTWKDENGKTITTFTPKAGVSKLTATSGSNSKTIYVVTKNADGEYVLYENDFSSATVDSLKQEGWLFMGNVKTTVSGGALHLGAKSDAYGRAILPAWLGDFGDYAITAVASQTEINNETRWSSIVYRIENENKKYYPYYHMCVRAKTATNTVEFAERNASDGWSVLYTSSQKLDMTTGYHTLKVSAFHNMVEYNLDGKTVLYVDDALAHTRGYVGLTSCSGVMNVDSIRVTLQLSTPSVIMTTDPAKLIDTASHRADGVSNYVSNHAIATTETYTSILNGASQPVAILLDLVGKSANAKTFEDFFTACAAKKVIPEFRLDSKAQVDLLKAAMDSTSVPETLVASTDAEVVKYARSAAKDLTRIRTALELTKTGTFDAYQIATATNNAKAQTVILPYELATKENVAAIQGYQLAVWAIGTGIDTAGEAAYLIASGANAILSDDWKRINTTQLTYFSGINPMTRTPVVTGHRGYHKIQPENSMSAFKAAYEAGADCIEIDVYLTADKRVVICHDGTMDRTTNGKGWVTSMTYDQIKQYPLKKTSGALSNEPMPLMDELLDYCKGKNVKIVCEMKGGQTDLAKVVVDLIESKGMQSQVVFISFDGGHLNRLNNIGGKSTGYLASVGSFAAPTDTVATLNLYKAAQDATLRVNSNFALAQTNLSTEFMRDAADRGIVIFSWTYSEGGRTGAVGKFINGMNGMTTDDSALFTNVVKTISAPATAYAKAGSAVTPAVMATTYGRKTTQVTNVKYTVLEDSDRILSIAADGKLTAVKDGQAIILASYTSKINGVDYTLFTQPITVKVGDAPAELTLNGTVASYKLDNGLLTGVAEGDTVNKLLGAVVNASDVKVYDLNGKEVTGDNKLGTGFRIRCGEADTYVVIRGDVNGDGAVNSRDYIILKRYYIGVTSQATDAQKAAMNVNNNDSAINARDYILLKRHCLNITNLFQ